MKVRVKQIVAYNGHSIKANGSVDFNLLASYSELVNTIKLTQLLNEDINIIVKVDNKQLKLGMFKIKNIVIDGDGESKIRFNGLSDYIEMDNLNSLPLKSDDVKEFPIMYVSDVEDTENDEW